VTSDQQGQRPELTPVPQEPGIDIFGQATVEGLNLELEFGLCSQCRTGEVCFLMRAP
jgi:hypothetical protein